MTELLKKAFEKAKELPQYEQDEIGRWLLEAIEMDERRWDAAFSQSSEKLKKLESQALDDIKAGRTEPIDPDKL